MQTKRDTRPPSVLRRVFGLASQIAREQRALAKAAKRMPKPVPWDWAAPRLVPLISGPTFDPPDLATMRARSALGPVVEFGMDLGTVCAIVDEEVARRWEVTSEQLLERSLANLHDRAARIEPSQVIGGALSGHPVRILRDRPHWASSVILDGAALFRLFGSQDQVLAVPTRGCLISMLIDTPARIVADVVVDYEVGDLHALMLDPFVLEAGTLTWGGAAEVDDSDW
jgi:hypothetical protein